MERVSVVGCSGSGKTSFARQLAAALDVPHVELDALHWEPGWVEATPEVFLDRARAATGCPAWVIDGNYQGKLGRLVWERADTVVWLDLPRRQVMTRVILRTLRRVLTRPELWNGNRESWRSFLVWRTEDSVIGWAWTSYPTLVERYRLAEADPANAHLGFHRLRTHREVRRWLAAARR